MFCISMLVSCLARDYRDFGTLVPSDPAADKIVWLLIILFILMLFFILLPTINLMNINISRIIERSSEIGIRKAFGASSWTLVGQFVVENVILTLIGGVISLILAVFVLHIINSAGLASRGQVSVHSPQ